MNERMNERTNERTNKQTKTCHGAVPTTKLIDRQQMARCHILFVFCFLSAPPHARPKTLGWQATPSRASKNRPYENGPRKMKKNSLPVSKYIPPWSYPGTAAAGPAAATSAANSAVCITKYLLGVRFAYPIST